MLSISINSAFFKEVYPSIPFSLAKAFNSATVIDSKSTDAVSFTASTLALGASFTASTLALGVSFFAAAFFVAPLAKIPST